MAPRNQHPNLSPAAQKALAYWQEIEYSAAHRLTTADTWSVIRNASEALGLESPGVTLQGINELRSLAVGVQRAARGFERLADSKRISGRDFVTAPWSRSLREQRALPKFQVRFQHTISVGGVESTAWRSSIYEGRPPRTAGELRRLVEGDAINLAKGYNGEHLGVDELQLFAV